MNSWFVSLVILLCLSLVLALPAATQSTGVYQMQEFKPDFVPVMDLLELMGAQEAGGVFRMDWSEGGRVHVVELRPHVTANLILLSGEPDDLTLALSIAEALDLPPRQIEIEAIIVEVDRSAARDLGIDWDGLWSSSGTSGQFSYRELDSDRGQRNITETTDIENRIESNQTDRSLQITSSARLSNNLHLLDETGAGTIRNTPKIVTLNNRVASILDGQRVTYVTRASSYSNIYETEVMDAGLKLDVLPTLGESGYLTLSIRAELTQLLGGGISGSPVKEGQIIDNTVIVKDGETILLGGFQRHVDVKNTKRFPILGHVFPFIFSREVVVDRTLDSFIVLTARVVDFDTDLDGDMQILFEGK